MRRDLKYDPVTGHFYKNGKRVGYVGAGGYVMIKLSKKKAIGAHRLAWFHVRGFLPPQIDHINGARADNRWANLREADNSLNQQNRKAPRSDSTVGKIGVSRNGSGYRARIKVNGMRLHLGTYRTIEEAYAVYVEAKRMLHLGNTI